MELTEFMRIFAPQLEQKADTVLTSVYKPQDTPDSFGSRVAPYPIQREVVRALQKGFRYKKSLFLIGEMGVGKTNCGIWTSEALKSRHTLIICPPHLTEQWRHEILKAYPHKKTALIPDPSLRKLDISNMATLQAIHRDGTIDFLIISREAIKTDFPTKSAKTWGRDGHAACPDCFGPIDYDIILKSRKAQTFCGKCGSALFQYYRKDHRARPSLAKYIQRKMKGFFDLIIFDEAHELKAGDSAQGAVLGKLGGGKAKILCMTGTLMGGKASDIFYLLYRTSPEQMHQENLEYSGVSQFVSRFGIQERIVKTEDEDKEYSIGRRRNGEEPRERPGLSPLVVGKFLIDKTAFIRLSDFAEKLPLYIEHPIGCPMHPEATAGYALLTGYKDMIWGAHKPSKVVSSAIQAMLRYTDTHREENVLDEDEEGEIALLTAPEIAIPVGETGKEQQLLRIIKEAKAEKNKILIYTTQTKKRDIQPRLAQLLEENGIKTATMYHTVPTHKRDAWIRAKTQTIDALICHPRLVATGMNLLDYPVIVFFDTGYSTYILRQASRRSYRINQPRPKIDVYYLYTIDTLQQDCLSLMAAKNEVSLMAEGEIQEGGLSLMSTGAGSIMSELARVINGELKTENPLEVFSRLNKLNNQGKRQDIGGTVKIVPTVDAPSKVYTPPLTAAIQMSLFE